MSSIKKVFFTSDWHIGHEKSIEMDNRPFSDVEHMKRVLINNFNASVPVDGVTYFLGDMGMCTSKELTSVMSQLNGIKILVLGNHDKGPNSMYNTGFDVVLYGAVLNLAKHRVTVSHCPLLDTFREDTTDMKGCDGTQLWHGNDRDTHKKLSFVNEGQFHLHGHIHSRKDKKVSKRIEDRQLDVGVCANNYRPVSQSQVESFIARIINE